MAMLFSALIIINTEVIWNDNYETMSIYIIHQGEHKKGKIKFPPFPLWSSCIKYMHLSKFVDFTW